MDYAQDRPEVLAELVMDAEDWQFLELLPKLRTHAEPAAAVLRAELAAPDEGELACMIGAGMLAWHRPGFRAQLQEGRARRQARAAVALLRLGMAEPVWPLFRQRANQEARSQILARLVPLGADADPLVRRLEVEPDVSARRALIMALGDFGPKQLPATIRQPLTVLLLGWYRDDPDPGIHGPSTGCFGTARKAPPRARWIGGRPRLWLGSTPGWPPFPRSGGDQCATVWVGFGGGPLECGKRRTGWETIWI
jgi:eukaryotic-like serine/threonine-protein kinase